MKKLMRRSGRMISVVIDSQRGQNVSNKTEFGMMKATGQDTPIRTDSMDHARVGLTDALTMTIDTDESDPRDHVRNDAMCHARRQEANRNELSRNAHDIRKQSRVIWSDIKKLGDGATVQVMGSIRGEKDDEMRHISRALEEDWEGRRRRKGTLGSRTRDPGRGARRRTI